MKNLTITIGDLRFEAKLEVERAPLTCAAFERLLPFASQLIQARWSGQAAWVPLGEMKIELTGENATTNPAPGEILFYPGGISEVELLFPYGITSFACKDGPLSGNHFLTITTGREQLEEVGRRVLWQGAQQITISRSQV